MSNFGLPPVSPPVTTQYSRVDLQAAFNWLVNQPDHVRKLASDPDRLMTLYYRSTGRSNAESEAPVSSQNFISDLRQINEALRQFEGPQSALATSPLAQNTTNAFSAAPLNSGLGSGNGGPQIRSQFQNPQPTSPLAPPAMSPSQSVSPSHMMGSPGMNSKTLEALQEVRIKLNLSSDLEALQVLVSLGYRQIKPLIG
jgi:hypothetical protein